MARYRLIENPQDGEIVTFVGCHAVQWKQEWGRPDVAFAEIEDAESAKDDLISRRGVVEKLREVASRQDNSLGYSAAPVLNALADKFVAMPAEDSVEMQTKASSLFSESRVAQDILLKAARNIDWGQVVLNGGPPCFALNTPHDLPDRFCGRSERWDGHGVIHNYVSLADLLCPHLYLEFAGASVDKCLDCSAFIPLASDPITQPTASASELSTCPRCSASMTDFPESRTSSAFCDGCGYEQPRNPITQVTSGLPSEQLPDASSLQPSLEPSALPEPQRRTGDQALETLRNKATTVCESFRQPFPVLALPEGGEQEYAPCPDERCNDTKFPIPQCVTAVLWAERYDEVVKVLRETAKRFDGIDSGTCKTCTGGFRLYDTKGSPQACDNKDCLSHRITAVLNYTCATAPVVRGEDK